MNPYSFDDDAARQDTLAQDLEAFEKSACAFCGHNTNGRLCVSVNSKSYTCCAVCFKKPKELEEKAARIERDRALGL